MAKQGWVPIHRQLQDHWLWDDKPFSKGQAWIDLLLLASHTETEFISKKSNRVIKAKRGCVYRPVLELSERWGWSRGKVDRFLKLLKTDNMIDIKRTMEGTVITIENYSLYNGGENETDTKRTMKRTMDGQWTDNGRTMDGHIQQCRTINNNVNNLNKPSLEPRLTPEELEERKATMHNDILARHQAWMEAHKDNR